MAAAVGWLSLGACSANESSGRAQAEADKRPRAAQLLSAQAAANSAPNAERGSAIGTGITQQAGLEQPVYYWDPVIAPSGMIVYSGKLDAVWKGDIFVGGLVAGRSSTSTLKTIVS